VYGCYGDVQQSRESRIYALADAHFKRDPLLKQAVPNLCTAVMASIADGRLTAAAEATALADKRADRQRQTRPAARFTFDMNRDRMRG
jgi:hypothetical protein